MPAQKLSCAFPHVSAPVPVLILGRSYFGNKCSRPHLTVLIQGESALNESPCAIDNLRPDLYRHTLLVGQDHLLDLDVSRWLPHPHSTDPNPALVVDHGSMQDARRLGLVRTSAVGVQQHLLILQPFVGYRLPIALLDGTGSR